MNVITRWWNTPHAHKGEMISTPEWLVRATWWPTILLAAATIGVAVAGAALLYSLR